MKATNAVIGGEGNGGVIYPALHYGRDSLVGVALVLSHLAETGKKMTELKASYPPYFMAKKKAQLVEGVDVDGLLADMASKYSNEKVNTIDGVKIDFAEGWVHLRKSNTEPIVRVYTEAPTQEKADQLGERFLQEITEVMK
jgi:phosphomannomutase